MATGFYDLFEPDRLPSGSVRYGMPIAPDNGAASAFGHHALRSVAPTGGGLLAGAGVGALGGSVLPGVGTLIGGVAGALGGSYLTDKAQDAFLQAHPDLAKAAGLDNATLAADESQHPWASFTGSVAPQAMFLRPGLPGWKAAALAGSLNAGIQTGQDLVQTGHVNPGRTALAFGLGATLNTETAMGRVLMAPGRWAVDRIPTGSGRTMAEQGAADTIAAMPPDITPDRMTPDERAAGHVIADAALTRASSPFQPGPAGDAEHGVRLSATMSAILDGTPLPPIGADSAAHAAGDASAAPSLETVKAAIGAHESGNSYTPPPNPHSSATGRYQFTDGSWAGTLQPDGSRKGGFAREVFPGKSDADLMALKSDPAAQEAVMDHALQAYAKSLGAIGAPATPGNLYLLHFLGPKGLDVLRADASTPVEALLPRKAIEANRALLQGKTAGELVRDMAGRAGGAMTPTTFADRVAADPQAAANDVELQRYAAENEAAIAAEADRRASIAEDEAAASAPGTDVPTRAPRQRRGPIDVATFLADRGGIVDEISDRTGQPAHQLVEGRNLQQIVPGAGKLIRPTGMPLDAAGELLWDHGYFGPPDVTPRPDVAQVLDLLEQTKGGKVYHPDDAARMADAAAVEQAARPPALDEARDFIAQQSEARNLRFDDEELDHAAQQVVDGVPWDTAMARTLARGFEDVGLDASAELDHPIFEEGDFHDGGFADEPGWPDAHDSGHGPGEHAPGPDYGDAGEGGPGIVEPAGLAELAGQAAGDTARLERFADPAGDGLRVQVESLEHDLRMEIEESGTGDMPFRLDAEGPETTLAEVMADLDADEQAWGELRSCLPAPGATA